MDPAEGTVVLRGRGSYFEAEPRLVRVAVDIIRSVPQHLVDLPVDVRPIRYLESVNNVPLGGWGWGVVFGLDLHFCSIAGWLRSILI